MLHKFLQFRLHPPESATLSIAWNVLAITAVVLLATQHVDSRAALTLPPPLAAFTLLLVTTFLGLSLLLAVGSVRGLGIVAGLTAGGVIYLLAIAVLWKRSDLRCLHPSCVAGAVIGAPLAYGPYLLRRQFSKGALLLLGLGVVALAAIPTFKPPPPVQERASITAVKSISISTVPGLVDRGTMDGGAIEPFGNSLLVVTGDGNFYRLTPQATSVPLTSLRLPVTLPLGRTAFLDLNRPPGNASRLRVTDLALDERSIPLRAYVAHQQWHEDAKCFTVRVSTALLDEDLLGGKPRAVSWKRVVDTWPCLPITPTFEDSETGGRLAWLGDKLLLTVGDHGYDGVKGVGLAQQQDSAYGKVLLLHPDGGAAEIFTSGHRNPQGLTVTSDERIWLTEHGPQGGDEVNLLERGRNYGWPLFTYGTDYGRQTWPLSPGLLNHGDFTEPAYVFVPSIAISSIIELRSALFPEWMGDLLIGSLRQRVLARARVRDGRVMYVETIGVGREIRDLAQGADGKIYLWTDESDILVIKPASKQPVGAVVYERCRTCHEGPPGGTATAPPLRGIVGRQVAASAGFPYSRALKEAGGAWTPARLDSFLADPDAFASGSPMVAGRVPDSEERHVLIEYLRTLR